MGPALLLIAQMYRVEKQARSLTAPERLHLRQQQSRPILDKLRGYLLEIEPEVLPKGPKGRINRNVAGTYPLVRGSANPDVGWEWLKFLSTKESQLYLAADGTVFPSLRAAATSPELMNPPAPSPRVNRKVFVDALEQDIQIGEPRHRAYNDVTGLVTKALAPVWMGEQDARSALQSIAGQADALLAGS